MKEYLTLNYKIMKNVWISEVEMNENYWYTESIKLVDWPHESVKSAKKDLPLFKSITKRDYSKLRIVTIHDEIN